MSATADKTQRVIFMLMPLVFVFVIAHFPAGLVLYWMTTNLWTVGQGLVTRRLIPRTPAPSLFKPMGQQPPGDGGGNGAKRKPAPPPKPAPATAAKKPAQPAQRQVRKRKKKARR
jgi:YidC/Oxa1 family membrane protein insertase